MAACNYDLCFFQHWPDLIKLSMCQPAVTAEAQLQRALALCLLCCQ
jgi:hypothetical protein